MWPAACLSGLPCGPALLCRASSGPVAVGALVGFPDAVVHFPIPGAIYWAAAGGTWTPAENRALCACCWPLPRQRRWARSASYPFRAPRWGCPWRFPPASSWAACAAVAWFVWTRSLTRPVSRTARPSTRDSAGAPGLFYVDADTAPFGPEDATPRVPRVCACACHSCPGRAGRAPGRVVVRLTFSCGQSWCVLGLLGPLRAGVDPFPFVRPCCLWHSVFSGPGCLGLWRLVAPLSPPFSFFFAFFFSLLPTFSLSFFFFVFFCFLTPFFFFLPCAPPLTLAFRVFRPGVPWALASCCPPPPWFFCFFFPPPFLFVLLFCCFFPRPCLASRAVRGWLVCPGLLGVVVCASVVLFLSLLFVRCSLAPQALAGVVWCCLLCLCVCCGSWLSSVVSPWVLVSCFGGAVPVWPGGSPPCGLVWCVLVLCCPVLCSVALCCRVVVCCRGLLFVCVVAYACCLFTAALPLLCLFWGVVLCVPCPLCPVRCCAALCWCPCAVLYAWSALFLVPGAVGSWCRCLFFGVPWWLWLPGVVVWWCVSALVSVSGRVSLRSASSLWCPGPLCCVLWCCAAVWCCAVVPCRLFGFFVPCWWRWFSVSP